MRLSRLVTDQIAGEIPRKDEVPDGRCFANHSNLQTALRNAVFHVKYSESWEYFLKKSAKHIAVSCQYNSMVIAAESLASVLALQDPCNVLPAVCSPHRR